MDFFPLINMVSLPPFLLINNWKSILFDTRMATSAFYLCPLDRKLFPALYSKVLLNFVSEVCFFMFQNKRFCFYIHSVSLCLFIWGLNPLILRVISDQQSLIPVILILVVLVCCYTIPHWSRLCVCVCVCVCVCLRTKRADNSFWIYGF